MKEFAREFLFTNADFCRVQRLIYQHSGIVLNEGKEDMVYVRLVKRLRTLHFLSFSAYLDYLLDHPDEREHFINALTTNLTAFFRETYHFPVLAEYLLSLNHRPVRIWCAAASSGEEAYSIAMVALETLGKAALKEVQILASDVDTAMLEVARHGVYARERVGGVSEERLHQFFLKNVKDSSVLAVRPELKKWVRFEAINLLDSNWPFQGLMDVVFCRNVMIYFDRVVQERVLRHLLHVMRPGALFFAGHSENLFYATDRLEPLGQTVYRVKE